jgi:SAM-dependent methyltransferase
MPRARGVKGLYLRWFGVPDVRVQLTARYLMEELAGRSFKSLLDVGCGNGMLTCLVASNHPESEVLGIDRDGAGIGYAARLAEQNELRNVRCQALDLEREKLSGPYDVIVCMGVLQFIRDVPAMLEKFHAALAGEGRLILQLPLAGPPGFLMRLPFARRRMPDFDEARGAFTQQETRVLLAESGFEIERLRQVIKGPAILAKEIFYLLSSIHPKAPFAFCPLLNWITVYDGWYSGGGQGLFVVAKKGRPLAE